MSLIVKSSDTGFAPPLWSEATRAPDDTTPSSALSPAQARVTELERRLESEAEAAKLAVSDAYQRGRADAEASFRHDESARLALTESALSRLETAYSDKFKDLETLSLLLCEIALESAFGANASMRSVVTLMLGAQIEALGENLAVCAYVSKDDFPDAAFPTFENSVSANAIRFSADPALKSGEARLELQLGAIEISATDYWSALRRALAQLLEAEANA